MPRDKRPKVYCTKEEGKTKQSFKDEVDINLIMKKVEKTGVWPTDVLRNNPQYGDFSSSGTYQDALNTVLNAQTMFFAMPAEFRSMCDNDPSVFLDFVAAAQSGDKDKKEKLVSFGLALEAQKEPAKTVSVPDNTDTQGGDK